MVLATKNPDKAREMREVLRRVLPDVMFVEDAVWDDIEETGATLEENALLKARAVAAATGLAALADDTGLEVDALGGAPGVHTARYAGPQATHADNRAALLSALAGVDRRSARFRTVIALVEGQEVVIATGVVEGTIATAERGSGGWGYDALFEVDGRTFAEIGESGKNVLGHRALALEALAARLAPG